MKYDIEDLVQTYIDAGVPVEGTGPNLISVSGGISMRTCVLNKPYDEALLIHGESINEVFRFDTHFGAYDVWDHK